MLLLRSMCLRFLSGQKAAEESVSTDTFSVRNSRIPLPKGNTTFFDLVKFVLLGSSGLVYASSTRFVQSAANRSAFVSCYHPILPRRRRYWPIPGLRYIMRPPPCMSIMTMGSGFIPLSRATYAKTAMTNIHCHGGVSPA